MVKLDRQGSHVYMSPDEVKSWYSALCDEYNASLMQYGVIMPKLGTAKCLWLVYLRKYQGVLVHKDTISSFVSSVNAKSGRDQQVRHLARDGWYVLNRGDRIADSRDIVPSGYHVLMTTDNPKPTFLFMSLRRAGRIAAKNFGQLKAVYGFRCATCGSLEGKSNLLEPDKKTELQQGHKNPFLGLTVDNAIPQCQVCNRVYQDDYVFDDKGRVVALASIRPVLRSDVRVQSEILAFLQMRRAEGG